MQVYRDIQKIRGTGTVGNCTGGTDAGTGGYIYKFHGGTWTDGLDTGAYKYRYRDVQVQVQGSKSTSIG